MLSLIIHARRDWLADYQKKILRGDRISVSKYHRKKEKKVNLLT